MKNKGILALLVIVFFFTPIMGVFAAICSPCDCEEGVGGCVEDCGSATLECQGDPVPGDGNKEGSCQDPSRITFCPTSKWETLGALIRAVANFIFWVGVAIVPLFLVIAGVMFILAGGDPTKVKTAKNLIFWAGIGLAVLLLAKAIASVIGTVIKGLA